MPRQARSGSPSKGPHHFVAAMSLSREEDRQRAEEECVVGCPLESRFGMDGQVSLGREAESRAGDESEVTEQGLESQRMET